MTRAAELALVAAASRALGFLEAVTVAETVNGSELVDELKAALDAARQTEGGDAR